MEPASAHGAAYSFSDFQLDAARGALLRDGAEVHLRPKSFRVLEHLVRNAGRLVTRRELMDAVWGRAVVTDDSLTQCLIDVRRALGDEGQQAIRTVPRRGFVFELPVTPAAEGEPVSDERAATSADPHGHAPAAAAPAAHPLPVAPRTWTIPVIIGFAAALGLLALWLLWRASGTAGTPSGSLALIAPDNSIAVLRFDDLSPGGDSQYFADGLAEEVLHRLAQSPDLVVIARSSSFAVGPDATDVREVAARLNVAYVLEGSIRREGGNFRVTAQLIEARTRAHIWSRQFDRDAADLIAVQDDIAASVAGHLHATLTARASDGAPGTDPAAQELYLQGLFVYNRRGPGDVARAREYFERAIAIQPDHARALTALAGALRILASDGEMDWEASFSAQKALLTRALAVEPDLAEAHARLAAVEYASGNREAADAGFQQAVALGPASPLVLGMRAGRALDARRFDEAIALFEQVARLDPLSAVSQSNLATALFTAGRLEDAEAAWLRAADLNPREGVKPQIAVVRVLQGRFGDAVELARAAAPGPERDLALAMAAPVAGTAEEAAQARARLDAGGTRTSSAMLAELLAFQGHADEAFAALADAVDGSSGDPRRIDFRLEPAADWQRAANIIRFSPFLAPLRSDPQWDAYDNLVW